MSGSLMSALMDPGVQALFGAAKGFAQAAMPSRLPVPLGAAIGMGAGGAAQGAANSQLMGLAQQQIQADRLRNAAAASALPVQVAKNQMLAGMWKNPAALQAFVSGQPAPSASLPALGGAQPSPQPTLGDGGLPSQSAPQGVPPAAGAGAASPSLGQATMAAYDSIQDPKLQKMAVNAAFTAGLPPSAVPAWISAVHNESGWNPNVPDSKTGAIGLGQVEPDTGQQMGFTPQQLRDPQSNLIASARYFKTRWAASNGSAPQALAGYNTGDVNAPDPSYVQPAMQRIGKWAGAPQEPPSQGSLPPAAGVPSPITPGQALTLSQQYMTQANQLEQRQNAARLLQAQGFLVRMPSGDAPSLRTAASQLREFALAGPTAREKALNSITHDRFGGTYFGLTFEGRSPEVKPIYDPTTGNYKYGDVGGIGVGAPPAGMQTSGEGQVAKPGPLPEEFMHNRGEDLANEFEEIDKDADSAKESNYLFDNLRADANTWGMGKFADIEGEARAWLSATAQAAGIKTPNLNQKLADFQAFNKSSGMLLRTAVHDVSSRAAVQEYKLISDTLPAPTTSRDGFLQIADQWQALSDYQVAKQTMANEYRGHPQDFNVDWNTHVSPTAFLINRMAQTQNGQQNLTTLFGRLSQTSTGRAEAARMQQEYRYAKDAGLFKGLTDASPMPAQQAQQ